MAIAYVLNTKRVLDNEFEHYHDDRYQPAHEDEHEHEWQYDDECDGGEGIW